MYISGRQNFKIRSESAASYIPYTDACLINWYIENTEEKESYFYLPQQAQGDDR